MDRRACWLGCMALGAGCTAALAQGKPRLIAVLNAASAEGMRRDLVDGLREGLVGQGLIEGRDFELRFRFAEGQYDRLPALLDELLRLKPAVLVAAGPRPVLVARDAKVTLPVVAAGVDDPVVMGIAQSPARPGGNFTGISAAFDGILERRLQLLADLVPIPRRFAVLANPLTVKAPEQRQLLAQLEGPLSGTLVQLEASSAADIEPAFKTIQRDRINGLVVLADASLYFLRHDIGERCKALKLPSVWGGRGYLDAGGVASYQGDFRALFVRSAAQVDKILKGTPPGEIPFEQGTKFDLVLNLRAARALGLTIPARVRVSADEVIE
ncbi:MAG TPA: ABC transporter substrate-binding protein [Burkholderiaceae bacterium]